MVDDSLLPQFSQHGGGATNVQLRSSINKKDIVDTNALTLNEYGVCTPLLM